MEANENEDKSDIIYFLPEIFEIKKTWIFSVEYKLTS